MKKMTFILLFFVSMYANANKFPGIVVGDVQRLWFGEKNFGGYKEFYSGALTALTTGLKINLWVTSCVGSRNIVTGGSLIK